MTHMDNFRCVSEKKEDEMLKEIEILIRDAEKLFEEAMRRRKEFLDEDVQVFSNKR